LKEVNKKEQLPLMNEQIKAPRVQLITNQGENLGVVARDEALRLARVDNLDLVMIAESGNERVPVVKIMDFGKELYSRKKKQTEAKKHQKVIQVKEIKIRPKIGEHDYETKIKQAAQFLKDGKRVKITLCFRGRENITKDEKGMFLFDKVAHSFEAYGFTDLVQEKDMQAGQFWSRIYYTKQSK
jgi:translation initiation factor IF-3